MSMQEGQLGRSQPANIVQHLLGVDLMCTSLRKWSIQNGNSHNGSKIKGGGGGGQKHPSGTRATWP